VVAVTPVNVNLVGTADKTPRRDNAAARAAAPQTVQLRVRVAPIADKGALKIAASRAAPTRRVIESPFWSSLTAGHGQHQPSPPMIEIMAHRP
jgi:hypothetical protein